MLVIHPHLHRRRTGVTSHVESMLRTQPAAVVLESGWTGRVVSPELRRTTLGEVVRAQEPLVWHAHRNVELLSGMLLRLLRRRMAVVWTRHAATRPSGPTRLLAKGADAVVALTPEVAGLLPMASTVVGHGVDTGLFQPPVDRAEAWRALGQGGLRGIGVVGRVRPAKGQQTFVEAWRALGERTADWSGVLVGGVQRADRAFAAGLAAARLTLVGEQPEIDRWYRGLTVLVQPSHSEGFGLTVLEGMASGCCVVATRIADVPTIIEHGRTGLLFDAGDANGLRDALEPMLREPARAEAMGRAAAEEVRARFSVEREAAALLEVYRRALALRRPVVR